MNSTPKPEKDPSDSPPRISNTGSFSSRALTYIHTETVEDQVRERIANKVSNEADRRAARAQRMYEDPKWVEDSVTEARIAGVLTTLAQDIRRGDY